MHPLEMTEDGLSTVEIRVLQELAAGAGASWSHVWIGRELTDQEVLLDVRKSKDSYNQRLQGDGSPVARGP